MTALVSAPTTGPPSPDELAFLRGHRVGRLATASAAGRPAVVPICYALVERESGPLIVSVLDEKPKRVADGELTRVRHIRHRPDVALVVDDYVEDWSRLAFVHVRGQARLLQPGDVVHRESVVALRAKYPQYATMAIERRPVIAIDQLTATSWRGDGNVVDRPRHPLADLDDLIAGRRSVRAFQRRSVPRSAIEAAIAAAGWAPSPHGRQPWRFAVVEAAERRAALADAMAATWRTQLELDGQEPSVVQTRLDKSRQRLHDAPVLVVPCLYLDDLDRYPDPDRQAAEEIMAIQSLGAAVQNLLLHVFAAGLDAGWMCAPLFCPDVVREALGLGGALIPHALIAVGYAAKDPIRRERLAPHELIVSWE